MIVRHCNTSSITDYRVKIHANIVNLNVSIYSRLIDVEHGLKTKVAQIPKFEYLGCSTLCVEDEKVGLTSAS